MDEFLVDCSIHLDGVPLKELRTFKCGHGFCKTCIDTLFAGPPPFKCPTCRKRIQRKDGLQIFLNPHRLLTQPATQSARRVSDVDIDLTMSDDANSTMERISNLHKKTREYATEITRLQHRLQQLQQQVVAINDEHNTLKVDYRVLQQDHAALDAQNVALKSNCTNLETQRNGAQRISTDLKKKYEAAVSEVQQWREGCKKARADALAARNEKESQDEAMAELAEREREFRHRAHANKLAHDRYKRKCDALRQELEHFQRMQQIVENPEDQSLLVVDRDAPDKLEHAVDDDWLDEVCEVRGDRLDDDSDHSDDSGKENEEECDELQPGPSQIKWLRGRGATESVDDRERPLPEDRPRPAVLFASEWNLDRDNAEYKRIHETKKRKNQEDAVIGARTGKLVKVSQAWGKVRASGERDNTRLHQPSSSKQMSERSPFTRTGPAPKSKSDRPLNLDSRGHLKGAVVLGSRRRFDKKS